jgi:hypothetical protein
MNDYRQRTNVSRLIDPSATSMGKFFSNRLRESHYFGVSPLPAKRTIGENPERTIADDEAIPQPSLGHIDLQRSIPTPSSSSSNNDSYFTHNTRDMHKFSRRVELSSGYNILKNRTNSRPTRLPPFSEPSTLQGQSNPLLTETQNQCESNQQRRLSLTDHQHTETIAHAQQIQQLNNDGTRRPFSSDSPLPPSIGQKQASAYTAHYISSAPPVHNRKAHEQVEPLKLATEQENDSIAVLSRELRAAAYPTTRKLSSHTSPTRETSPTTARYMNRTNVKRAPPRSLPKINNVDHPNMKFNSKSAHLFNHQHDLERTHPIVDNTSHNSMVGSFVLDQFFSYEHMPDKETVEPDHEIISNNNETSSKSLSRIYISTDNKSLVNDILQTIMSLSRTSYISK